MIRHEKLFLRVSQKGQRHLMKLKISIELKNIKESKQGLSGLQKKKYHDHLLTSCLLESVLNSQKEVEGKKNGRKNDDRKRQKAEEDEMIVVQERCW